MGEPETGAADSGAVDWDDVGSGAGKQAVDLEETVAFDAADDESSAVDLGKSPARGKGTSSGIDEVAEALESGVISPAKGPPSVEFSASIRGKWYSPACNEARTA